MKRMPGKSIEETYQKKSQLEHILLRPDTYVGSIEQEDQTLWVVDRETIGQEGMLPRMVKKNLTFVPGLYKIFDEILVNAADNKQRDPGMKEIVVKINQEKGYISVRNDGKGIPVTMHKKQKCYVPEMIFGHLLTSSNYNDTQKKTVGGRNGYGAKLANIFSRQFVLETVDSERGLKYKQTWRKNMSKKDEPQIKSNNGSSYTKITFHPDFKRFGLSGFTDDLMDLFCKRVFDIAGTVRGVKVVLDGYRIRIKSFEDYVKMFFQDGAPIMHCKVSDRWQVAVALSEFGGFQNISHVNNIWTIKGGTHVKLIVEQVTKVICDKVNGVRKKKDEDKKGAKGKKKPKKKAAAVKPGQVKNHLFVFVNSLIENPAFSSQTKEELTLKKQRFGSECMMPESFLKKLIGKKLGIVEAVSAYARFQEQRQLKKSDGKKTIKLAGIPKLEDANDAGGRYSSECTLILTEGDSAAALARSGVAVVGADRYGVFPLRGKLLNVRDAKPAAVQKNAEVEAIKKILGLKQGANYMDPKTFNSLRYGHLMVMTDQDHDGSHIKGLVCNLIHTYWPTLIRRPGFMTEFITPIVKCTKGGRSVSFHTLPEYENWKEQNNDGKGWNTKYYKGLGTSTSKEAKEYFAAIEQNQIDFRYSGEVCDQAIDLAFSKKKVEARKAWLARFVPGTYLDMNVDTITYEEFVNKELILFSNADNKRSIPCIVDGLKPSQRKVLFCCFKKKLKKDIKVAQFQGYVSEKSAYHHGEASLQQTIVGMAQNFVGSNNINLLYPSGQFGTRHMGGKDSASPRYIFTRLCPITRHLFHEDDDCLLNWLDDDGQSIEPEWYIPVIPMVLVNGADGIGTGWSTQIPNFNPRQIIRNIRKMLRDEEPEPMEPWYKGWTGRLEVDATTGNYRCYGSAQALEEEPRTLVITELPIRSWNASYKKFLEDLQVAGKVDDIRAHHTDNTVSFTVKFTEAFGKVDVLTNTLLKTLKLAGSIALSNLVLFNERGQLRKYKNTREILEDFFKLRLHYYNLRKNAKCDNLSQELRKLDNKCRFILMICNKKLKITNRKKRQVMNDLECAVPPFDKFYAEKKKQEAAAENTEDADDEKAGVETGFNYLLKMTISKLTFEEVEKLKQQRADKEAELNKLMATPIKAIWRRDLQLVEDHLNEHEAEEDAARREGDDITKKARKRSKARGGKKGKGGRKKRKAKQAAPDDPFSVQKRRKKEPKAPKPSSSGRVPLAETGPKTNYGAATSGYRPYVAPAGLTKMLSRSNKAAAGHKPTAAKKSSAYSLAHLGISDSSDEEGGMSLAQRLNMKSGFTAPTAPGSDNKFSVLKKRKRNIGGDSSDDENLHARRKKARQGAKGELLESD